MIFKDYYPRPELAEFIRLYHLRHFEFKPTEKIPYKAYPPRPEQCIIFYPRTAGLIDYVTQGKHVVRPRAVLVGQQTQRINLGLGGHDFLGIVVVFNPGMLYRLTGISQYEITHTEADAEAVFTSSIARVN